ncbi:hypothetical protein BDA96_10G028300 [Sorghum bicolor]|uniref:DUF3615 domain-containing protein n=1 Tax=Sorghum bicolor TaxID=4558 RepID=A0A921PYQ8_SORBI|nr:hypothetical protein BDA96_10G028300 [Sorghum bicolor]
MSEELVAAAAESVSALTLQEPDVTSSEDLIEVVSSEELITVSPQTLPAHNTTEGSAPSGHSYSASSGPTIFCRRPPAWYFTFFIRRDRGGCFHMYPDMGGPFQSLKEAEDTIDAHIFKLQRQAMYNEQDDVPSVERLIRRCVFYPDGTPKRGPNCPARKNPYYRERNLVQAILDQYNDDHNLLGDLAHELKGDVSFQWIHEKRACYYHFNFTTRTKEAGIANLFFAEVSRMQRDGDWVLSCCCMIGPNDNGGCYSCASDDSPDIKHPSHTNSYTGGHVDEYLRFGGDSCSDSDDDEEVQVAKLRIKFRGL